jgi:hypothetical protein
MNYKNQNLNITIENIQHFKILEKEFYIILFNNDIKKFTIYDNSTVWAYNNSTVKAFNNSTVEAYNNSTVESYDNSTVWACGNSTVKAYNNSTVESYDNSTVWACGNSTVKAYNNSTVESYDNSTVWAYDNSTVKAYDNSTVKAYNNSTVLAYNNSTVLACGNSTVKAYDFSCIYIKDTKTTINQNNHFGAVIKQVFKTTKKLTVYKKLKNNLIAELQLSKNQTFQSERHDKCRTNKAKVLKIENIEKTKQYKTGVSNWDRGFIYEVGKIVSVEDYDENIKECSTGIHFFLNRKAAERF